MLDSNQVVWVVDAFFSPPRLGNPAAVILLDGAFPETRVLQETAAKLRFPTLAVAIAGQRRSRIRWFTPQKELDICGHASFAAATVLGETMGSTACRHMFKTEHAGELSWQYSGRGAVSLDLPIAAFRQAAVSAEAAHAIGAAIESGAASSDDFIYELENQQAVAGVAPDFTALARLPWRGHVITAQATSDGADFVSRAFFPALGVDEDQVCVSAHCKLAPYWAALLGKTELVAVQLSERGGVLKMRVHDNRVQFEGQSRIRRRSTLAAEYATAAGGLYRG